MSLHRFLGKGFYAFDVVFANFVTFFTVIGIQADEGRGHREKYEPIARR